MMIHWKRVFRAAHAKRRYLFVQKTALQMLGMTSQEISNPEKLYSIRISRNQYLYSYRSSRPEVFSRTGVLEICSKFTGIHPSRRVISIKLQSSFIEIALKHGCSPMNVLHIFRTSFPKNTSGRLLLVLFSQCIRTLYSLTVLRI